MEYGDSWNCEWEISAPSDQRIWLNITDLDLENHGGECSYDSLTLYSSIPLPGSRVFCEISNDEPVKSLSNRMLVKFKSDSSVHYSGFSLDYKAGMLI